MSYGGYLRLPELLAQQRPQSQAPDELLFITIHQVYELWFKLLLHELEVVRAAMFDDELWRARLRRRLEEPTLWDAYVTALSRRGLPVSDDDEVMAALLTVARDRRSHDDLWQLAEDLLTHDETTAQWRMRHVQMVERQIGTKSGTGGSTGAPYLRGRARMHYFPLLWELRARL